MARCRIGLLALTLVSSTGCQALLTSSVTRAPNEYCIYRCYQKLTEPTVRSGDLDGEFWVETGPPRALIWCGVLESRRVCAEPTGTVIVLHGVFTSNSTSPNGAMYALGRRIAGRGYRVVLVDLRGHGLSTGRFITHGIQESQDLIQVINALTARGRIRGPIGLVGYSYGAATALHLAARDERVGAVVAIAAPVRLRESLPHFAYTVLPAMRRLYSDRDFQRALDIAGWRHGFDPDKANPSAMIQATCAPVLLLYADDDAIAPPAYGMRLQAAGADRNRLLILPGDGGPPDVQGHLQVIQDRTGMVSCWAVGWLERHLQK